MVQISKNKLPDDLLTKLFLLFFEVVGKKSKEEDFNRIINDLFSPTEQIMIVKRIAIIFLLLKGKQQQEIADVLKVSPSTVCKFSIIVQKSEGIVPYIKQIIRNKDMALFLTDIFSSLFLYPGKAHGDWKAAWDLKRAINKEKQQGI